ncbi:MAG: hypothetical protein CMN56_10375 [Sneathiella sp.]|uniref:DUF2125 domain-containing protein n=1 Tax=Sneathiella sp. TaxID=1964365 RepID=UPI000C5EC61E|nr:DUF2125 domain-containing protein [Sneathiella sp.]MAZ03534.1 hypothetical protein [Sneathiella sp.]
MRILYSGILALIVIAGGYVYWWHHVADRLVELADNWRERRISEGYDVTHDPLVTSGFPYRVKVTTENLALANPTHVQSLVIRIPEFWAVVQPWQINHVIFGTNGDIKARWQENGEERTLDVSSASALGSATFNLQGRLQTVALDIRELDALPSWHPPLTAHRVQLHGRPMPPSDTKAQNEKPKLAAQQIVLRAEDVTVDSMADFPLGRRIEDFSISAVLHGQIPRLPAEDTLAIWRDNGGYVDVEGLNIKWGQSAMTGEGAISLDDRMRPLGILDTRISGYGAILAALTETRQLDAQTARTIGFGLNLLSREDEEGRRYIALPLSAQDGGMYLGPVFLMQLGSVIGSK